MDFVYKKKIYILDICMVNILKMSRKTLIKNKGKMACFNRLKQIDFPNSKISYTLAFLEKVSSKNYKLDNMELEEQVLSDLNHLCKFYKFASVTESRKFLLDYMNVGIGDPIELDTEKYITILEYANNNLNLYNAISVKNRFNIVYKLIEKADEIGMSRSHPVILVLILHIYGDNNAKRLLKLKQNSKDFNPYNSLSDIMHIIRLGSIVLDIKDCSNESIEVEFLTDDKSLFKMLNYFKINSKEYNAENEYISVKYDSKLNLPKLLEYIPPFDFNKLCEIGVFFSE